MKGIILDKAGGTYTLTSDLPQPTPGKNQILVKSLVAGLNPVENFQLNGLLVDSWPIVLGCDASGTVVELGEGVTKFKKGDGVFSCTRLGAPGCGTFQEYFLMDEALTFKKPDNITSEQAATIGVGILTAALGLFSGTKIAFETRKVDENSEWIIILGATGAVGQFAVQLGKICGYKVLGSCSPSNDELIKNLSADATVSYKVPEEEQLSQIASITGGNFTRLLDASSMAGETGMKALAEKGAPGKQKYFATTNDWTPLDAQREIEVYMIHLGLIGKSGDETSDSVNKDMESFIPELEKLLEAGTLKPIEHEQVGSTGVEGILEGLEAFNTRKSDGKKLLVRVGAE